MRFVLLMLLLFFALHLSARAQEFEWPKPLTSKSYIPPTPPTTPAPSAPAVSSTPAASASSSSTELTNYEKPIVLVRITGFNEDLPSTPRINFDAVNMANELVKSNEKTVVILLERNGVALGRAGTGEFNVNGNWVDFRKNLKVFMGAGGQIVINKKWADELYVQQCDLLPGVRMYRQEQVAKLLIDSEKILDYATPNYPVNLELIKLLGGGTGAPPPSYFK